METPTQIALISAAQAGDKAAFETLVEPYQRELLVHCYRMLGSVHDAEDLVQETLVRAWEKRATFASPGSYRAWLYRIATHLCLNALRRSPRRSLPSSRYPAANPTRPLPPVMRETIWLEPFPDDLLANQRTDPEARAERSEAITLAFLVALHHLTPAQRAILLLREVLEWDAREVAEWLNLSIPAVNSALQRARRTLRQLQPWPPVPFAPSSSQVQSLLDRYVALWEQGDVPGLVALLREDACFSMPPIPAWFQGRAAIATFFQTITFTYPGKWRLLPTHANASPLHCLTRCFRLKNGHSSLSNAKRRTASFRKICSGEADEKLIEAGGAVFNPQRRQNPWLLSREPAIAPQMVVRR
jgi:RNA polymerase sigma-70 factor (ECF subfamily)